MVDKLEKVMDDLPEEIVVKVLSFLSPYKDFDIALLVCRKWYRVIRTIIKMRQREFNQALRNGELFYSKHGDLIKQSEVLLVGQNRPRRHRPWVKPSFEVRNNRKKEEPSPRFSHNACIVGNHMYVFGGCKCEAGSKSVFNDLFEFDLVEKTWCRKVLQQGYMPAPRECSTLVAYKSKLLIFGGWCCPRSTEITAMPKFFNDTKMIDLVELKCLEFPVNNKCVLPGTRAGHSACISNDMMVIFGGAQRTLRYDDVWVLEMKTLEWNNPCIKGKKPEGRFGQSQFAIGDDHILIVGGWGSKLLEDAWLLSTKSWTWSEIEVGNKLWQAPDLWYHPAARVGDLVVTFSNQIVCNNCFGLHINQLQNTLLDAAASIPSIICAKCKQNRMKINQYNSLFQIYTLDLSNLMTEAKISWIDTPSFVPLNLSLARGLFTIVAGRGEIIIFGGLYNSEKLMNCDENPSGVIFVKSK